MNKRFQNWLLFFYHYSNCLLEAIGYLRVLTINAVNWDGLQLFLLLVIVKKYHHDISYLSRWVWFFLNTKFVIIFNFYHLFVVNVFIHLPIFFIYYLAFQWNFFKFRLYMYVCILFNDQTWLWISNQGPRRVLVIMDHTPDFPRGSRDPRVFRRSCHFKLRSIRTGIQS